MTSPLRPSPRRTSLAILAVASTLAAASAAGAAPPPEAPKELRIPYTASKLANGMTLLVHEDHTLPLAVVNVSYQVGSRYEVKGRTGFAHLFEHLMFMGTQRAPTKMFDAWMEDAGGWNNAWTSEDRTDYFDVGPPTALPLLLWLEADRLRDLGPLMTKEKLDAQRAVVKNERRQTSENRPYGRADLRIPELLYPESHPYHHPVIGSHADLEAASVDDVKQFFATWYDPANASLVVAGDVDPAAVKAQVDAQFGAVPSRGVPKDPGAPGFDDHKTTLSQVVRETLEDRVELPKIIFAWQSPRHFGPGDAELDLAAAVLATGKASRLYKSLVYDQKLAQGVEAQQASGFLGSRFVVEVLVRPGVSLDKVEAAVDKELERLRREPITDGELERARNGILTSFVGRLESVRERASLLNLYQAETGDPGYLAKDVGRYTAATAPVIRDVVAKVLVPGARVIVRVLPPKDGGKKEDK